MPEEKTQDFTHLSRYPRDMPNYIGYWVKGPELSIRRKKGYGTTKYSVFKMFIDSEKDLEKNMKEIQGRITDEFGTAEFKGRMGEVTFQFTKKYIPGKCKKEAASNEVIYDGRSKFSGMYGNEHTIGSWSFINKEGDRIWGSFLLEEFKPSETLEFLISPEE